ncbi:MAG: Uma2 family endonuclease [Saprospiraceae bacterium]|nr:Uma2 family endonuclease [Saprospiraceae bacterium]
MKEGILQHALILSEEAYIAFEENSPLRHELIQGNLYQIPGTTLTHNDICINITLLLRNILRSQGGFFKVQQESVKVQVSKDLDYTYPDVVVISDPRDLESQYIIRYPPVIFEVMSKHSRTEDAADKFIRYKNIESLHNYILVDSEKRLVEVRVKRDNGIWESESYLPSDLRFPVPYLGVELDFDAVYEGVKAA